VNENILSVQDLSARFGDVLAVDKLSFDVRRGEVFALVGPKGAGKTTLLKLIARLCTPSAGAIAFEGELLALHGPREAARLGIARTFDTAAPFEHASVQHILLAGCRAQRRRDSWRQVFSAHDARAAKTAAHEKLEQLVDLLGLGAYREALVAGLPPGVRRAVGLALALCSGPKLLLLDEPSSGLSTEEVDAMAACLTRVRDRLGVTVMVAAEGAGFVGRFADRVLVMAQGRMLALGAPNDTQPRPVLPEAERSGPQRASQAL
jgi:branched-chain amino acid transport system ATP-binding protein